MATPPMLTLPEVQERLHVSRMTVLRLIDRGEILVHKVGRQLRFQVADVEAYLAGTRVTR